MGLGNRPVTFCLANNTDQMPKDRKDEWLNKKNLQDNLFLSINHEYYPAILEELKGKHY